MMMAEDLRNSILQLAMQGRLVEHREEEGTGEELYKRIKAEKKKLKSKEKKTQKITDEDAPFEIPETWKWTRLGEIIEFRMGKTPPRAESVYWGNDISWISIADMIDGGIVNETKEKVSRRAFEERFNGQISPKGTLIMSFKLSVGKVSILGLDAVHNEAIISIFPVTDNDNTMRDYLKRMLPFLSVYGESKKAIKGFTLNSTSLSNIPVPLPPLEEQKRIVAKLDELMPFVEQYAVASTKLNDLNTTFPEMMKKSILQEAVQGKLVPQDPNDEPASELLKRIDEEKKRLVKEGKIKKQKSLPTITEDEIPFEIPDNWEWVRLGSVITDTEAGKSPQCKNVPSSRNEWGVIKTTAIQDGFFLEKENKLLPDGFEIKESQVVHAGDLLITRAGPQNRTGIACVVDEEPSKLILSDKTVRLAYVKGLVSQKYLMYVIKSPSVQSLITAAKSGMAASQVNISQDKMKLFLIPIPPLKEQERIVQALEQVLPLIEKNFEEI